MAKKISIKSPRHSIKPIDVFSTVPAAAHFIETNMRVGVKNIGNWLKTIDDDSLSYIFDLFKPIKEGGMPEGMSLPVCDIVSLCLLSREWEGGNRFGPENAWDDALPLIPRLRRAIMFESLRRKGIVDVVRFSNGKMTDDMLASFMGVGLIGTECADNGLDYDKTICEKDEFEFFDDDGEKLPPEEPSDWH